MKMLVVAALCAAAAPVVAQETAAVALPAATATAAAAVTVPANTLVQVTPVNEINSKRVREGDTVELHVVSDIVENGMVVIPRGTPVKALVSWRTGKGIVGKSAKFEITFKSVSLGGRDWALRGTHRQEGRGNTAAALLASWIITGKSAIMTPGQIVNAFTAEPITK